MDNDDIILEDVIFNDEITNENNNDKPINPEVIYNIKCPICGKIGKKVREIYKTRGFLKKRHYLLGYKSVCNTCGFIGNYSAYRDLNDI